MSRRQPTGTNANPDLDAAVAEIQRALDEGRAPRGARTLQLAARRYQADSRAPDACGVLRTLARLELRRGNDDKALGAARSALRLARKHQIIQEADRASEILSRIHSRLGEHDRAQAQAREWLESARGRGDQIEIAQALRRLALAAWAAGDPAGALGHAAESAEAAREAGAGQLAEQTERTFALMLLHAGCPTTAHRLLTGLIRTDEDPEAVRMLLARGWASMCLGDPDAGARDFRKARGLARKLKHRLLEIETTATLAVADLARAGSATRAPRPEKSRAALERALSRSGRLKDPDFEQKIQRLHQSQDTQRSGTTQGFPGTALEAAHAVVELAKRTDNLTVVDACVLEGRRLRRLAPDQAPYGCDPALLPTPD